MPSKVDTVLARIPTLSIDLEDVLDFKGRCVDPLAVAIITESLDYALETSIRRLESVAKINPAIRDAATETILPAVKTLRDLVEKAPRCPGDSALGTAPIMPPPPKPKRSPRAKKGIVETLTEKVEKATPEIPPALATLSPRVQQGFAAMKEKNPPKYKRMLLALGSGKSLEEAAAEEEGREQISGTETIERGKQFTIANNGDEIHYMFVANDIAGKPSQVPEEEGVLKLSETSALARAVMGKKPGDSAGISYKGKKYGVIKEVKEGTMKVVGE